MGEIDLRILMDNWFSPMVTRDQVEKFSGGMVSKKYMANLDCKGEGPSGRFRVGRKVVYPVAELVTWLEGRAKRI